MRSFLAAMLLCAATAAIAHDDGRFAGSPLKGWFDSLASGKGLCCSFADGVSLEDIDWDIQSSHYRVRLDGKWVVVPDEALITEPNRYGCAVVWPVYQDDGGVKSLLYIRCFMPGAGT